jgi:hypothetical protein
MIPAEEGTKETKNKWRWMILIDHLSLQYREGVPFIERSTRVPEVIKLTTGTKEQEFELIDKLTTDKGIYGTPKDSMLYKILKTYPDGTYRLTVLKQTPGSKAMGRERFAFWNWCWISKNKDVILWETRDFQAGSLMHWNLETRDPREDARRKNYKDVPSGGVDKTW